MKQTDASNDLHWKNNRVIFQDLLKIVIIDLMNIFDINSSVNIKYIINEKFLLDSGSLLIV